jgi:hypothetical protein
MPRQATHMLPHLRQPRFQYARRLPDATPYAAIHTSSLIIISLAFTAADILPLEGSLITRRLVAIDFRPIIMH